ncbi:MAG: efflux RND transporter periplasmic adaptor subunit [Paludibacteraceae bacterium]|nr:efflux RND transporter periplasmic adaptor subunit [Paludibacteraceae bacterium]
MKKITIILAAVLLCCGCHKQPENHPQAERNIISATPSAVSQSARYSAAIQGKQDIMILPQVGGFLTKLCVSEGQQVKLNQPLFEIDRVNFEAALRVAEANVEAAQAAVKTNELTYSSKQKLYEEKVISEYDLRVAENQLLTARAGLAQAEASVTNARQNLSYCTVKAPCNGVVGRLPFRVGSLVSPQMPEPLTTVSDNSEMYVYFSMTEAQMLALVRQYGSIGKAINELPDLSLQLADGSAYNCKGRIESISGIIDKQTGAVSVRAVFPNPDRLLLSGGSCNVVLPETRENVIVIPQTATYEIQNKTFCYRVIDGKAVATLIQVEAMPDGKQYIVSSGLTAGERIIAEGAGLVRDGEEVE